MSKSASRDSLSVLHAVVAGELADQIIEGVLVKIVDEDGQASVARTSPPASVLVAAIRFLKDNQIECDGDAPTNNSGAFNDLMNAVEGAMN